MNALKQYHPVVGFSFFLLMVILSLASMQPVFQLISFVAVVSYSIAVSGLRAFVRGSWWVSLLIVVVMLFNSVFGGRGLSTLFSLDLGFIKTQVTVEGLFYGLIMGLMLANVILWFNVLGKVSSMQGFIEMFARFSPTAGMMLARITVFIPELLAQARLVDRAQSTFFRTKASGRQKAAQALGGDATALHGVAAEQGAAQTLSSDLVATDASDAPSKRSRKGQFAYAGTLSSHLMEWGMEKSLITANSMVARGYGSRKRTSYRRTRLTVRDTVPLVVILVLGLTSLVCSIWSGVMYEYYPYLTPIEPWWGYVPLLLLCLVPLALHIGEELAWWQSR